MPRGGKTRVNLNRGFDNIGSNRSQAARIQVVPCGLRKDDVVKAKKDAQSVVKAIPPSVASDNSPKTGEQYKTSFQQLSGNLFHPCLRGGVKGGGVTSIKHQLKIQTNMKKMKKYRCKVCKWVYDPEFGDIKGGIPANTAFEDLPADWVCPVCKAERSKFEEME